jgi:hypothetical protein
MVNLLAIDLVQTLSGQVAHHNTEFSDALLFTVNTASEGVMFVGGCISHRTNLLFWAF